MASWSRLSFGGIQKRKKREGRGGGAVNGAKEKETHVSEGEEEIIPQPFSSSLVFPLFDLNPLINSPRPFFEQLVQPLPRRVPVQLRLASAEFPLELGDPRCGGGEHELELRRGRRRSRRRAFRSGGRVGRRRKRDFPQPRRRVRDVQPELEPVGRVHARVELRALRGDLGPEPGGVGGLELSAAAERARRGGRRPRRRRSSFSRASPSSSSAAAAAVAAAAASGGERGHERGALALDAGELLGLFCSFVFLLLFFPLESAVKTKREEEAEEKSESPSSRKALAPAPPSIFLTTCSSSVFSASKEERGFKSCCFLRGDVGDGRRAEEAKGKGGGGAFFRPLTAAAAAALSPSSSASSGAASSRAWRMRRRGSSTGGGAMVDDRRAANRGEEEEASSAGSFFFLLYKNRKKRKWFPPPPPRLKAELGLTRSFFLPSKSHSS